ncbi:aminotransferase class I/II-fold pyridoxal phosphate-dependent enzyme [Streptomyces sp. J2-1]|uniref:threonine aldolase family protein n=1 Tax=Streptomyces corallincola TaxID=2851888 RepID=UPI001C386A6D|nr:aminotransferase class I/II-fold pyridoxal phosphate-dependent enzyme [Streptomyces corallincola]MBV2354621.1 aminotransferase class I/II-fold pyridoxal phosphate-dependent enzyme [Streptomyces corallincola]
MSDANESGGTTEPGHAKGSEDVSGPESAPDGATGPDGRPSAAELLRERRGVVQREARRVLNRPTARASIRDRLTGLLAAGEEAYDLDRPTDVYGDRIVGALEERVASLLGKEAAVFFPTGTMAQQVALRCWAGRTGNPAVALHGLSHPEVHERQAFSQVSGLRPVRLTSEPRQPTAEEIRDLPEPVGAVMLELPLRDAGFLLPTWEELTALVDAARERDAVVHFDGARLWETTEHFGRPLDEIADLADSVYVSFYKSLDGLGGAALAGPRTLVEEARTWRHRYGGMVFQQFPTALSALIGLDRALPRLPEYVRHARVVATALREGFTEAGLPWFRINPETPHTHEFQVWLPHPPEITAEAAVRQAEQTSTLLFGGWWDSPAPGISRTEVSLQAEGLEWSAAEVGEAAREYARLLREV